MLGIRLSTTFVKLDYFTQLVSTAIISFKFADVGLSPSVDIQTKSIVASKTTAIGCDAPAYMVTEMQVNQLVSASQDDLRRVDLGPCYA